MRAGIRGPGSCRAMTMIHRQFAVLAVLILSWCAPSCAKDATVSLYASGQPVREVLQKLSDAAQVAIVLEPGVRGNLDLALADVSLTAALNAVCRPSGATWKQEKMRDESGREVDVYHVRPVAAPAPASSASKPATPPASPSAAQPLAEGADARKQVVTITEVQETRTAPVSAEQLRALVDSLPDIDILMVPRSLPNSGRLPTFRPLSPGPAVRSYRPYLMLTPYGPYIVYPRRGGMEYDYVPAYVNPALRLPGGR